MDNTIIQTIGIIAVLFGVTMLFIAWRKYQASDSKRRRTAMLEAVAWRDPAGAVSRTKDLDEVLDRRPIHAVLVLSGFAVGDRFANEEGCHIWHSPSAEPEIVFGASVRADNGPSGGGTPALATDRGGSLYLAWADRRIHPIDIFANRSSDYGVTFSLLFIVLIETLAVCWCYGAVDG